MNSWTFIHVHVVSCFPNLPLAVKACMKGDLDGLLHMKNLRAFAQRLPQRGPQHGKRTVVRRKIVKLSIININCSRLFHQLARHLKAWSLPVTLIWNTRNCATRKIGRFYFKNTSKIQRFSISYGGQHEFSCIFRGCDHLIERQNCLLNHTEPARMPK